jgi:hypothetical protein
MKSNLKLKMAIVSVGGLLASGVAYAGAPVSFGQFSVTNGVITDTSTECTGLGWTCTSLDATGAGILMQQVTDPNTGLSFLRTITTEADANGNSASIGFFVESQVYANGINSNNIALLQGINDNGMVQRAEIYEGAFRSDGTLTDPTSGGAGGEMLLSQTITGAGQTFQQQGVNSNVRQRIDQAQGTNPGRFSYAVVAGNGQGLYEPTAAGQLGGTTMPALAYNAGDALAVVWIGADQPGTGAAANRQFGFQEFRNYGTATGATVLAGTATPVGTSRLVSNQLPNASAPYAFVENGSWDWDTNIFDLGGAPTGP